jgi:hypothetical protein
MYRIDFFIGMPYASPRQKLAEALTEHDDHVKAVAVAREKAQLILNLLAGKDASQVIVQTENDEDYVDGKLTAAARQRLIDERLVAQWGPHPLPSREVPKQIITSLEVQLTSDTGQISLFDLGKKPKALPPLPKLEWRPSGDYQAQILLRYGEQKLNIGNVEFANTTAVHALTMATEQARQLIDQLKKSPGLGFLSFNAVTIHVERINTQMSMVEDEPGFDWTELNYPAPRF